MTELLPTLAFCIGHFAFCIPLFLRVLSASVVTSNSFAQRLCERCFRMQTDCRLVIDPPQSGPWNMAVDEALLLDAVENGNATLRFYQWSEPTLSLGYFQATRTAISTPPAEIVRWSAASRAAARSCTIANSPTAWCSRRAIRSLEMRRSYTTPSTRRSSRPYRAQQRSSAPQSTAASSRQCDAADRPATSRSVLPTPIPGRRCSPDSPDNVNRRRSRSAYGKSWEAPNVAIAARFCSMAACCSKSRRLPPSLPVWAILSGLTSNDPTTDLCRLLPN